MTEHHFYFHHGNKSVHTLMSSAESLGRGLPTNRTRKERQAPSGSEHMPLGSRKTKSVDTLNKLQKGKSGGKATRATDTREVCTCFRILSSGHL